MKKTLLHYLDIILYNLGLVRRSVHEEMIDQLHKKLGIDKYKLKQGQDEHETLGI